MTKPTHSTQHYYIGDTAWQEQVKHKLLDGFGIDDIALWLDCHRSHVSAEVRQLRERGDLAKWFSK